MTLGAADTTGASSGTNTTDAASVTVTDAGLDETTVAAIGSTDDGPGPATSSTSDDGSGESAGSTGPAMVGPDYVLSIDDQGVVARLLQVDTMTAVGDELCLLPPGLNYNSLTFSRDGVLFAHSVEEMAIDRIDPCSCDTVRIAEKLPGNLQLTSDEANGLYALDLTNDEFAAVNPATGALTTIGPLGVEFENSGVAWNDEIAGVYALDGLADELLIIDVQTGAAAGAVPLPIDFGSVGLDFHPGHGLLYACDQTTVLSTIDPASGGLQMIGEIGGASCDNIAAPFEPVDCLE